MFQFVERSVTTCGSEFPMLQKHTSRLVVQAGLQPVAFMQDDIRSAERPLSLLGSVFSRKSKRG